jgi:hypothetical protein
MSPPEVDIVLIVVVVVLAAWTTGIVCNTGTRQFHVSRLSGNLEESGGAHTATDAHGDNNVSRAAPLAFDKCVPH